MPRLTRTQKFADLREALANDKETSLQTKDLSGYESRLNNITGEEPRRPEVPQEDPKYVWTAFEDIHNEAEHTEEVIHTTISDLWNSVETFEEPASVPSATVESGETVSEPAYEETEHVVTPVETAPEEPVKEETAVEETPVTQENPYLGLYQRNPEVEAAYEEAERIAAEKAALENAEPVSEEIPAAEPTYEETVKEEPAKEETPEISPITDYILENPFAEFDEILSEKYVKDNDQLKPAEVISEPESQTAPVETPAEETVEPVMEEPVLAEAPVTESVFEEPVQEETVSEPVTEEVPETETAEEIFPETPKYTEEPLYTEVPVEEEEELDADAIEPQPVQEETTVEETPVVQEENPYLGLYQRTPEVEAAYEEAEKLAAEKAEEEVLPEETAVEETVEPVFEEAAAEFAETPAEEPEAPESEAPVAEELPELPTDNHVPEHTEDSASALIHQTISEVDRYNEENGDLTIHTLTSNMVNEIRHGGNAPVTTEPETEKFEEVPVTTADVNEEEFSNTVSMEITKIMNEVAENEDAHEIPVEEIVSDTVVEEHPVLAKALEEEPEEEVVEIRNLNELDAAPMQNTLSNTIPFVVAASDDEEIIDDDAQEDSNTILNIILIILIVILVAVLGLIIFYILKTKGII